MPASSRDPDQVALTLDDIRAVAAFAIASAEAVLPLFEAVHSDDPRPRAALDGARTFAAGGPRLAALRVLAADAHRAGRAAATEAAREAALSAGHAAAAAYLHPLAKATQVKHILGSAACAARTIELQGDGDPSLGDREVARAKDRASWAVVSVLRRYPPAGAGRGRTAELMRDLDVALRE